jgi:hypothetical protein
VQLPTSSQVQLLQQPAAGLRLSPKRFLTRQHALLFTLLALTLLL